MISSLYPSPTHKMQSRTSSGDLATTMDGNEYRKGLWNREEDSILMDYVKKHGTGKWNRIAKSTGLKRCGKSCRLRWMNYLSPNIKRGGFSQEEEDLIIRLHNLLGNRWSLIAGRVPGRTDNQVKNYWNTHLSKKLGVKKGKSKAYAPLKTLPNESKENSNNLSKSTGTSDCHREGEGEKTVQASSHEGFTNMLETIISDGSESTFGFPDAGLNLYTPYLTKPFHDYFVDLDWVAL